MIGAPLQLRRELTGGRLDVADDVPRYGIWLDNELCIVRAWNQTAGSAVLVVELLPGSGIEEQRAATVFLLQLVEP